jgi:hypothetical protein
VLDLVGQTLDLETSNPASDMPVKMSVHTRNLLTRPEWALSAEFTDTPVAAALEAARKLGAPLPPKLAVEGTVDGAVRYDNTSGFGGNVELSDVVMTLPDATPLKAATATVFLKGQTVLVGPVTVGLGDSRDSAEVECTYQLGEGGGLELKIGTRHMSVSSLRNYGFASGPAPVPMMDRAAGGTWRGALKYAQPDASTPTWTGDFELQNTQVSLDGLVEPVRMLTAAVSVRPERVAITGIKGKAGAIDFSGDWQWDVDGVKPPAFRIRVEEANIKEVERLLRPAVSREGGLFARTLGIGSNDTVPDWLAKRRATGTLLVKSLTVAGTPIAGAAQVAWNGSAITLSGIQGKLGEATMAGQLRIDLSGRAPAYGFTGKVEDLAYKGGRLDFNGTLEASGTGAALLASVHAAGVVRGRSLTLSPDAEYRRASGRFMLNMTPAGPLWKLSGLELSQGSDIFVGAGTLQADGKLALDIHRN